MRNSNLEKIIHYFQGALPEKHTDQADQVALN